MTESIYKLLDGQARNWWYNAQLREWGKAEEARKRERKSIRDNVKVLIDTLNNGGYMQIGSYGYRIQISDWHSLSGYYNDSGIVKAAVALCVQTIDVRENPTSVISAPMVGVLRVDPPPWGSFSFAPLEIAAEYYLSRGNTLVNFDHLLVGSTVPDHRVCSACGHQLIAHFSFASGEWGNCIDCGCQEWNVLARTDFERVFKWRYKKE